MEERYWVYLGFIVVIPFVAYKYAIHRGYTEYRINLIIIVSIVATIGACTLTDNIGTKRYGYNIGHFFEHGNYETKFYVYVSDNIDKTKSYRLPADIRKTSYGYYFIKAYWPNGGTLSFYEPVKFYYGICFPIDDNDNEWRIELTDFRVYE